MITLDARQTALALPYPQLSEAIESILMEMRSGTARAPERLHFPLVEVGERKGKRTGILLIMTATNRDVAMTKHITVHPENRSLCKPSIMGEVLVFDPHNGERLMLLDGPTVTGRRTAAVTLLAAKKFAPRPQGTVLIVGAGVQARSHLEAFVAGLGSRHFLIYSRSHDRAQALADHAATLGAEASVVETLEPALGSVSIIVTATTSTDPVLPDSDRMRWRDDVFVAGVGAFRPDMRELPPQLCRDAAVRGTLVVDTWDVKHEAGDLLHAGIDWGRAVPLMDAILTPDRFRSSGPVLFKSVGYALWDLAAVLCARASLARDPQIGTA
ncbi:ornithine cyclodeaminase [Pandoraea terrae]|uniref:Ornithine cyclodeaminase n=1 Tax=Pandoraea terrae TaxID=1537710 RepID=A0A5E4W434_9BURK|nr:delta(1)-pyrroline-2-carboxylate reductase family protein [Pandoraea terrae]VVE17865.1 ornithine cyclodeaminase [Pandoraea terrae]